MLLGAWYDLRYMSSESNTWPFEVLAVGNFRSLEKHTKDGAEDMTALAKWRILNRLHDRNETLYYRVSSPLSNLVLLQYV